MICETARAAGQALPMMSAQRELLRDAIALIGGDLDSSAVIEAIRPGDRVFFEPGENHWHGAAPTRLMTHIAIAIADASGSPVTWGRHVSDDEYAQAPSLEASGR